MAARGGGAQTDPAPSLLPGFGCRASRSGSGLQSGRGSQWGLRRSLGAAPSLCSLDQKRVQRMGDWGSCSLNAAPWWGGRPSLEPNREGAGLQGGTPRAAALWDGWARLSLRSCSPRPPPPAVGCRGAGGEAGSATWILPVLESRFFPLRGCLGTQPGTCAIQLPGLGTVAHPCSPTHTHKPRQVQVEALSGAQHSLLLLSSGCSCSSAAAAQREVQGRPSPPPPPFHVKPLASLSCSAPQPPPTPSHLETTRSSRQAVPRARPPRGHPPQQPAPRRRRCRQGTGVDRPPQQALGAGSWPARTQPATAPTGAKDRRGAAGGQDGPCAAPLQGGSSGPKASRSTKAGGVTLCRSWRAGEWSPRAFSPCSLPALRREWPKFRLGRSPAWPAFLLPQRSHTHNTPCTPSTSPPPSSLMPLHSPWSPSPHSTGPLEGGHTPNTAVLATVQQH